MIMAAVLHRRCVTAVSLNRARGQCMVAGALAFAVVPAIRQCLTYDRHAHVWPPLQLPACHSAEILALPGRCSFAMPSAGGSSRRGSSATPDTNASATRCSRYGAPCQTKSSSSRVCTRTSEVQTLQLLPLHPALFSITMEREHCDFCLKS